MKNQFFGHFWNKAIQLEGLLKKHQYFSMDCLPGVADTLMFQIFDKEFPQKNKFPYLYYWYINIKQFSQDAINSWSIKSEKDYYFLSILKRYEQKMKQGYDWANYSKSESQNQEQNIHKSIQSCDYRINIKFRKINKRAIENLKNHIKNKAQIISEDIIGDSIVNIIMRCDPLDMQLIKVQANKCQSIISFQITKPPSKKIARAQTLCTN